MGAPSDAAEADAPADPGAVAAAPLAVASVVGSGSGAPTAKDPPVDDTSLVLALPPFTPMNTPLTRQELRVVQDARDTTQRQYGHVIIDCKSADIQINGKEMRRMRHGEWLWDVHIDLYMHLLNSNAKARKSKHCYCFNSSLMNQLTGDDSGKYSYGLVRRRADLMRLDCFHGEDLFAFKHVLLPMNVNKQHWILFHVDNEKHQIRVLGSYHGRWRSYLGFVSRYMADSYRSLHPTATVPTWALCEPADGDPYQGGNATECGAFVVSGARHISCSAPLDYGLDDMPRFRERLTLEMATQRIK